MSPTLPAISPAMNDSTAHVVREALRNDVVFIEQLCSMVNNYAGQLGLGRKVRAEDFTEKAKAAMNLIPR